MYESEISLAVNAKMYVSEEKFNFGKFKIETQRILSISNNCSSPKQSLWSNLQHFSNNRLGSGAFATNFFGLGAVVVSFQP